MLLKIDFRSGDAFRRVRLEPPLSHPFAPCGL